MEESKHHVVMQEINEEQELILQAKKEPAKFGILYNRYYEKIVGFIYQRVDSKDAAFDIASQVFLKAMTHLKSYENRNLPFSAWLYRIAINEMNQAFRQNKTERALNVDLVNLPDMIQEMNGNDREELYQHLVEAMSELPEEELQLVELRFFEKRSFKEIGDILNITENNAKVKTYRTLDRLKKMFADKNIQL